MNRKIVNPDKVARVAALKKILAESKSVAVVDYTGLKVAPATQLRRDLKAAGGEMKVEKNTLFRIALQSSNDQFPISNFQLSGLSAFVFSKTDEVAALKALADFMKKHAVGSFKAGLLGDRVLTADEISSLAQTPNREMSVAKMMYVLSYHTGKLVRTLAAIAASQGGVIN